MKLLFCKNCHDVFNLNIKQHKTCSCGKTSGHYTDDLNAVYYGEDAIPLGFMNSKFAEAVVNQPKVGMGKHFTAFVIPEICPTMKKLNEKNGEEND